MAVDITINETIDVVDITVNPNIIEVNVTRTSGGGGGSQTLAQTLDLGNTTGGENILVNNADAIELENSSKLSQGIVDSGTGGNKGIALTCAVGFEWKFEAGEAYLTETNSEYIRLKQYARSLPSVNDDISKGFVNGSFWYLDSGIAYICTDSTNGAAVWEIYHNFIPTLQQVVNEGGQLTDLGIAFDSVVNPNLTAGISIDGLSFIDNDGIDEETTVYASNGIQRNLNANGTLLNFETPTNSDNVVLVPNGSGTLAFTSDIPTTTSQLTNDGADGVNPFITALDIPVAGEASTLVREVKNMTGATLTKGTVVYISGANGNKALVSKAIATTDALSARTFGLLQSNILNNGLGNCVIIGDLSGINTSAFAEGAQLYLSGVTAGTFTDTRVLAPTHLVYVGKVTRSHPTQGQIEVQIQNGYELAEIHDCQIVTPLNNQTILYETSSELWKNKTIIEDSITNGVTDVAPSQNAVFDALALKQNKLETFNRTQGIYFFEEFMGAQGGSVGTNFGGLVSSVSGVGAACITTIAILNKTNQQGVVRHTTGTTLSGFAGTSYGNQSLFIGQGKITLETYVTIETLSTSTERFFTFFGYAIPSNWQSTANAIFFSYDEGGVQFFGGAATPNWKCYTRGGTTITLTTTSIPVVASQWYKLRIEINNAGNSVTFFIDGVLVATHTTNIPATTTAMSIVNVINKTVGITARTMQTDYFMYEEIFTTAR
jgi:hypothetical protein